LFATEASLKIKHKCRIFRIQLVRHFASLLLLLFRLINKIEISSTNLAFRFTFTDDANRKPDLHQFSRAPQNDALILLAPLSWACHHPATRKSMNIYG